MATTSAVTHFRAGSMHRILPAGEYGAARILIDSPDPFSRFCSARDGQPLDCEKYTRLMVNGALWMTDTEFEWRTNLAPLQRMTGDVLMAGLGIGFVAVPAMAKKEVNSITVIEKHRDVIALVSPHLDNPKLKIIEADAYTWEPPRKSYDCIYFDIWAAVPNSDNLEEIMNLKKRYRPALRRGGWMAAWCESFARRDR
jgi:spermidine synthase